MGEGVGVRRVLCGHRTAPRGEASRASALAVLQAPAAAAAAAAAARHAARPAAVCVCVCVCEGGAGGAREAALWQRRHRGALGASLPFFVAVKRGATARPHAHLAARHAPHSIILNTPGWQCTREAFWTRVWGVLGVPRGAKPYWNVD